MICCYNSSNRLLPTLQHLSNQQFTAQVPWELIIVDNASTDDTGIVAQQLWVQLGSPAQLRIVKEARAGTDHARRRGVYASKYDHILFCDDDNWLDPGYLQKSLDMMDAHPTMGLVGGQSEAATDIPLPGWFYGMSPYYAACAPAPKSKDFTTEGLWSAGLMGRTVLLRAAFDPQYPFLNAGRVGGNTGCGEDAEMCMRVALKGYSVFYDDQLRFKHHITTPRLSKQYADALLASVQQASVIKGVYQRALFLKSLSVLKRRLFIWKQYFKWQLTHKRNASKKEAQITRDYLYFYTGKRQYGTALNEIVFQYLRSC